MSKPKVFVTRPSVPKEGLDLLRQKFDVEIYDQEKPIPQDALLKGVKGKDGLLCLLTDTIDKAVLDAAGPQLKVIATMSVGYDHIDIEECKKRKIGVSNTPHVSTDSVAEFTVLLLLAVGRKLLDNAAAIKKTLNAKTPDVVPSDTISAVPTDTFLWVCVANRRFRIRGEWVYSWSPLLFCGQGLKNSTVGIVGMGRIGQAVMKRIQAFDVSKVLYHDVFHPIKEAEEKGAIYTEFEDLLKQSDFVVAMCNLSEETKGVFNKKAFELMKPSAVFINTSRGGVVNQDDLYDALKNNKIKGAGLDVMVPEPLPKDHKLTTLPNLVLCPHVASAEVSVRILMAEMAARNIINVLGGKALESSVY